MVKKKIVQKEPYEINIEKGKKYAWCSCGLSNKQPFCDGSHSLTKYKPIIVVAKNNKTVFFCGCKHTKNAPFCDGTNSTL